jgi:hypothetical protein
MLVDYITQDQDVGINFKEYMAWFRISEGFTFLKQPGLPARTTVTRTAQAFKDLGFRFTKYNRLKSLRGIHTILGQRNYEYIDAIKIAVKEDSIAFF